MAAFCDASAWKFEEKNELFYVFIISPIYEVSEGKSYKM